MSNRLQGTVKWFNNAKGYGFIQSDIGQDVFVHYDQIKGDGYRTLNENVRVEFGIVESAKGSQATDVTVLEESSNAGS